MQGDRVRVLLSMTFRDVCLVCSFVAPTGGVGCLLLLGWCVLARGMLFFWSLFDAFLGLVHFGWILLHRDVDLGNIHITLPCLPSG
jgi:hypothetical protein